MKSVKHQSKISAIFNMTRGNEYNNMEHREYYECDSKGDSKFVWKPVYTDYGYQWSAMDSLYSSMQVS